jgi:hypothetical protein
MDIRILHHHESGFGWSFDSPDIPGLIGGTDDKVRFEHFVPAGAAA